MKKEVAIALGANLGDRLSQLKEARDSIKEDCATGETWAQSAVYHTSPVECPEGAPDYLNAVIIFSYEGSGEDLLTYCKALEVRMGRLTDGSSGEINQPRLIDADILYLGAETIDLPHLIVPHPRLTERRFVLEPLAEVRGDQCLPGSAETIAETLRNLNTEEPSLVIYEKEW